MIKADFFFNIFLFALSIFTFSEGLKYPYEFRGIIGSGFFPVWMSVIMFFLTLANLAKITVLLKKNDCATSFFASETARNRVAIFFLSMIVYVFAITYLGMYVATFLYALFVYKIFDRFSWKSTLPPAIGLVVFVYLIFNVLLGLNLPAGFWAS